MTYEPDPQMLNVAIGYIEKTDHRAGDIAQVIREAREAFHPCDYNAQEAIDWIEARVR
jgi:hypothetical protein